MAAAAAADDAAYEEYLSDTEYPFTVPQPTLHLPTERLLVVDGLPVVGRDKYERLRAVLNNFFRRFNAEQSEPMVYLPQDGASEQTKGFAFVEMESVMAAKLALEQGNGYALDKNHTFRINTLDDYERLAKGAQAKPPVALKLASWRLDARAREQFIVRHGPDTTLFWYDAKIPPTVAYERKNWTDDQIAWSPQGNYVVTFHQPGVAVWGGPQFERLQRLPHNAVNQVSFSPCERYLVTGNASANDFGIIIWDTVSGKKLAHYAHTAETWPEIKWSHDGKYYARLENEQIQLYSAPEMALVPNITIRAQNVKEFEWSPSDYYIAYWIPEMEDRSANVAVFDVNTRSLICNKNVFSVKDCAILWHPDGTYLSVQANRYTKSKKGQITNFEIFRVREKNVPVELLEYKEKVVQFAWEPKGTRFSVIHGDGPRPDVSFFDMNTAIVQGHVRGKKGKTPLSSQVAVIKMENTITLPKRSATHVVWSPAGHNCVVAGLRMQATLEFYNVDEQLTLGEGEHFMCTNIDWDPSGRFVCSYVNFRQGSSEAGFCMWAWTGVQLCKKLVDRMTIATWRPRPSRCLLSEEQIEEVKRTLKKFSVKFEREDKELLSARDDQAMRERLSKRSLWKDFMASRRKFAADLVSKGLLTASDTNMHEVTVMVEETISETRAKIELSADEMRD